MVVHQNVAFLVADERFDSASWMLAELCHLHPVGAHPLHVGQNGDLELKGRHFLITDSDAQHPLARRLSLFPRSWAGFQDNELQPAILHLCPTSRPCGLPVLTVTPASTCAALVRLHARTARSSTMSFKLQCDLAQVIAHSLFDTSYEGNYEEFEEAGQPETEKEAEEKRRALEQFSHWTWRPDEMWIADALKQIIAGRGRYECLPWLG